MTRKTKQDLMVEVKNLQIEVKNLQSALDQQIRETVWARRRFDQLAAQFRVVDERLVSQAFARTLDMKLWDGPIGADSYPPA